MADQLTAGRDSVWAQLLSDSTTGPRRTGGVGGEGGGREGKRGGAGRERGRRWWDCNSNSSSSTAREREMDRWEDLRDKSGAPPPPQLPPDQRSSL